MSAVVVDGPAVSAVVVDGPAVSAAVVDGPAVSEAVVEGPVAVSEASGAEVEGPTDCEAEAVEVEDGAAVEVPADSVPATEGSAASTGSSSSAVSVWAPLSSSRRLCLLGCLTAEAGSTSSSKLVNL